MVRVLKSGCCLAVLVSQGVGACQQGAGQCAVQGAGGDCA